MKHYATSLDKSGRNYTNKILIYLILLSITVSILIYLGTKDISFTNFLSYLIVLTFPSIILTILLAGCFIGLKRSGYRCDGKKFEIITFYGRITLHITDIASVRLLYHRNPDVPIANNANNATKFAPETFYAPSEGDPGYSEHSFYQYAYTEGFLGYHGGCWHNVLGDCIVHTGNWHYPILIKTYNKKSYIVSGDSLELFYDLQHAIAERERRLINRKLIAARNMLQAGMDLAFVARSTGVTEAELIELLNSK